MRNFVCDALLSMLHALLSMTYFFAYVRYTQRTFAMRTFVLSIRIFAMRTALNTLRIFAMPTYLELL